MTFVERVHSLSARFLTERSYELIVAPAIADLQHDADGGNAISAVRARAAVAVAFGGALYDELTADSTILRLGALTFIPACYYTFLLYLCQPQAAQYIAASFGRLAVPGGIAALSIGPVLACCWPRAPHPMQPDATDA